MSEFVNEGVSSLFITGITGSGKSHTVRQLINKLIAKYNSEQLKFALFDMKRVDFNDFDKNYLLFDVVVDPEIGVGKLEGLARLATQRLASNEIEPRICICIDECDMAIVNPTGFFDALEGILTNSKQANMQLVYVTSRFSEETIPPKILDFFDTKLKADRTLGLQPFDRV